MLLLFYKFFFFLLMLDVSLYYFFIYSYCTYKVSPSPEMITPIRLLLHLGIGLEQLYSKLSFQYPHQFRYGYPGWYRHQKVNVVNLNTQLLNLTFLPFTQHLYVFLHKRFNLSCQYPKSILGKPNNVVITFIYNMRELLILTHITNIGKPKRTLPPSKRVGF